MIRSDAEGAFAQFDDRFLAGFAGADELDDFVDVADGEDQAFENVPALLGFAEQEAGTADDDLAGGARRNAGSVPLGPSCAAGG